MPTNWYKDAKGNWQMALPGTTVPTGAETGTYTGTGSNAVWSQPPATTAPQPASPTGNGYTQETYPTNTLLGVMNGSIPYGGTNTGGYAGEVLGGKYNPTGPATQDQTTVNGALAKIFAGGGPRVDDYTPMSPYASNMPPGTDLDEYKLRMETMQPELMYRQRFGIPEYGALSPWEEWQMAQYDTMRAANRAQQILAEAGMGDTPSSWSNFLNAYNPTQSRQYLSSLPGRMGGIDNQTQKELYAQMGDPGMQAISMANLQSQGYGIPFAFHQANMIPKMGGAYEATLTSQEVDDQSSFIKFLMQRLGLT